MIDFQQIIEWFNSIYKLSGDMQPVVNEIKKGTKTKTLDGIQFIDFDQPSLSNIRQLNQILKENGLEEIDEELLKPSLIDIEQVLQRMKQDFTENELAKAIEAPEVEEPGNPFVAAEIDLADICAPQVVPEDPGFAEKELIDAACEPVSPVPPVVTEVKDVPTTMPKEDLQPSQPSLPGQTDSAFSTLMDEAKKTVESDLFPKNGPDCIEKMREITKTVQEKVDAYTNAKKKIQEIQLDYYYQSIENSYYESFILGYMEIDRLKDVAANTSGKERSDAQKMLSEAKQLYSFAEDRSNVQAAMQDAIWRFSNQFDVEIESGFLGLFESVPKVRINKDKLPIEGKVKSIPDDLIRDLDSMPKDSSDSATTMSDRAKKAETDLDSEFQKAVAAVKDLSFAFGVNQFLGAERLDQEFLDLATASKASYDEITPRYLDLKKKEKDAQKDIDSINQQVMSEMAKLNCKSADVPAKVEAGKDLGFKNVSKNPTIFDYAWWLKFCSLATLVNLVPVHWPVGLLIPTPSGLIKIPFPIVWFPVFIAPTDKMIAVLLIGQCGILPCPYLFLQHFLPAPAGPFQSNNPYFAAAIGGPINISSHKPLPPGTLPSFNLVFNTLNAMLEAFRNGVVTDVRAMIEQVKNQLEDVQKSADRYLALTQKDMNAIVENAKKQAQQQLNSAKDTAQQAIKAARNEGQRLIDDARARYKDAIELGNITLSITQNIQAQIDQANKMIDDARKLATDLIADAEKTALALKKRAEDTVKGIIENGKKAYEQKLDEIQQLKDQYEETVKTLRDLINKIKVPAIDLGLIDLSSLLSVYSLSLGSLVALATSLSPKAIQFGFPTELSPKFSASLPMFKDELPPWERLSLLNIPLLFFLWKWCKSGKFVGGFLPESIVGPI